MRREAATGAIARTDLHSTPRISWLDRNVRFVLLGPAIAYFLLLGIFPTLFSLFLVFNSFQSGTKGLEWVGLRNLVTLSGDARFWNALILTIAYVLIVVGMEL